MNKLSPTNLIADIRAAFAVILLGYVLLHLFTDKQFDAAKTGIEVTAIWAVADKLLGSVLARYTADSDATTPPLKADASKAATLLLMLCACFAVAVCMSACAGSAADTDFRRKASDVKISGNGGATPDGAVTAGGSVDITLRNPDASK